MSSSAAPCDCGIVVIALVGGDALAACLRSVGPWQDRCVVVLGESMEEAAVWRARFPASQFVEGKGLSVPLRRQRGVGVVGGRLVAMLEDTSLPVADWLDAVCAAFVDERVAAAAGPVRIDPSLGGRFRALACTEYGKFHPRSFPRLASAPPAANGTQPVSGLPGNNLAYRREPLLAILDGSARGLVEGDVNAALVAHGFTLAMHPRMAVVYAAADVHGAGLRTRFLHGRLYAGNRAAGVEFSKRLAWSIAALLILPAMLSARALSGMTRALPPAAWPATAFWICAMECAWATGESIGYLAGAGRSIEAWR